MEQQIPAPRPAKKSLASKLTNSCSNHPGIAMGIILVLLVLVIYLYARLRGWIGQKGSSAEGGRSPQKKPKKKSGMKSSSPASSKAEPEEEDAEIDDLIRSIES